MNEHDETVSILQELAGIRKASGNPGGGDMR